MTIATRHVTPVVEPASRFSARLREGTRAAHEYAEGSPFVTDYLAGAVPLEGYAALQGQLWFVYEALEEVASQLRADPTLAPLLDVRLDRLPALAADLRALLGDTWRDSLRPGAAAAAHAARIRELAAGWRTGYVAHHYIRYLGDLSGGRALGAKARAHYGLVDDGVRFYRFDAIEHPREFKHHYRRLLDDAPWTTHEQDRIIEEARVGFRLSRDLFDELAASFQVGASA